VQRVKQDTQRSRRSCWGSKAGRTS
jgi:hypothetical protein